MDCEAVRWEERGAQPLLVQPWRSVAGRLAPRRRVECSGPPPGGAILRHVRKVLSKNAAFRCHLSPEGDVSVLGSAAKDLLPCHGRFSIESHESSLPTVEAPWLVVAWRLRESVSSQEKQIGPLYERQTTLFCWCSFVVGVCVWSARLLFAAWCACPSRGQTLEF